MNPRIKSAILSGVLLLIVVALWFYREDDTLFQEKNVVVFSGSTMGTHYSVKYLDKQKRNFQEQIDSIFFLFNQSLSTYIPDSEISRFNRSDTLYFELPFFYPVLEKSREIYEQTGGAFDPTVMPLVNAWGFGPDRGPRPDSALVDSLLDRVGFDKIRFDKNKVYKTTPGVQLDFSALAKGYGVDVAAGFLTDKGIENLMVEIGGEVVCKGKNQSGGPWRIGVQNPLPDEGLNSYEAILYIDNKAMATSGNYLNYYTEDGATYVHTISPFTGYPVQRKLLSATVIAPDCITADAFATAFMVMGLEKTKQLVEEDERLEGYLIYLNARDSLETYYSRAVEDMIRRTSDKEDK